MIVAGFGFRANAPINALLDALSRAAKVHQPTHLATPDDKADTACVREISQRLHLPVIPITSSQLAAIETLTQSPTVFATRGVGSIAEACALAAAGPGATLASPRSISADRNATCAIALGAAT